eukprot:Nitzschia sp. Nitz4//scaffold41_size133979//51842//52612//NITZ4_003343-RA/size133979-snap-gene-0.102-mRNA-1//1//CDS//3329551458//252//frame0
MEVEEKIQRVAFIRHGVAKHNVLDAAGNRPDIHTIEYWDPPLLYQGKRQALEAGERLKLWWKSAFKGEQIQLIVTSPLTRCLQTATLGFLPGDVYADRQAIDPEPTFYCTELVREAIGEHYSDKRRIKSLLQKHWSHVEFETDMPEDDELWFPDHRETIRDMEQRIDAFLQDLVKRSEKNMVVVSHGVWIEVCFHRHCFHVLDNGRKRVHNCNVFVGECVSRNGEFVRFQNMRHIH